MRDAEPRIDGHTRLVGVMGWPIEHSRSPRMHNAAFRALGLNWVYLPLAVAPPLLPNALRGLPALGFAGCNVTVPHKADVVPLLDEASAFVKQTGSANTIAVRPDGSLYGDSTDGPGFLDDLQAHGIEPRGLRVLLFGAGGAARSIVYCLCQAGADVTVANRTVDKAVELVEFVAQAAPAASIRQAPVSEAVTNVAPQADLIVNATSVGLAGSQGEGQRSIWAGLRFRRDQVAYDIVYTGRRPLRTAFLELGEAAGAQAIDGLGMLVYQGARSFELWTGAPAPVDVMFAAVEEG